MSVARKLSDKGFTVECVVESGDPATVINDVANKPITDELIELTAERIAKIRVSEEGQEGLSAFFDKRSPAWQL